MSWISQCQRIFQRSTFIRCQQPRTTRKVSTTTLSGKPPPQATHRQPNNPSSAKPQRPPPRPPPRPARQNPNPSQLHLRPSSFEDASSLHQNLRKLLKDHSSILLYRAAPHGSFKLTSYAFALFLSLGAVSSYTTSIREPPPDQPPLPRTTTVLLQISAGTLVLIGIIVATASTHLIRTVTLVRSTSATAGHQLRFRTEHALSPFRRGKEFTVPLSSAAIDRNCAFIHALDIPIADSTTFTKSPGPLRRPTQRSTKEMLIAPCRTFAANARRMVFQYGMVNVRIKGHGTWRLDFRECEVLMAGKPLVAVMVGEMPTQSMTWLRMWMPSLFK